ncbi:MAG: redoxin domain-containing protein [bacterium]|nr:redoxin domain-containing protein [bacterium]
MKRWFVPIIVLMVLVFVGCTGEKKDTEIKSSEKKVDKESFTEFYARGGKLMQEGKAEEVLKMLDSGLTLYPEQKVKLMDTKFQLLMKMKRYKEALPAALETDKLSGAKSAYKAYLIATIYMRLEEKDNENAFKWLTLSVDRGFNSLGEFEGEDAFETLKSDKRFAALLERIKDTIGLGKPVKPFTVKDMTGKEISPADYKGKVLLLDFWATWCPPCVKEIPNLKADYNELNGQGFEIIGISLDKDKSKLENYLKENDIKWAISFSGDGWKDETAKLYGVNSIPATWLVDKKGILRYVALRGPALKKAVMELIKE